MAVIHTCSAKALGIFFFLYGVSSIPCLLDVGSILVYLEGRRCPREGSHGSSGEGHVVRLLVVGGVFHAHRLSDLGLVQKLGLEPFSLLHQYEPKNKKCADKEEEAVHYSLEHEKTNHFLSTPENKHGRKGT